MGTLPLWVPFGLASVLVWMVVPLLQERINANPNALAFWVKAFVALFLAPLVWHLGLPTDPFFYTATFCTALLWSVGDVVFFRTLPIVGAAVVTRLLPLSIIFVFFTWFFFDPALLAEYLLHPVKSIAIAVTVCASSLFAFRLKKCAISWNALRLLWFIIFASCADTILVKLLLNTDPTPRGAIAFVFCQALMMLCLWLLYFAVKKPITRAVFFSKKSYQAGALIGLFCTAGVALRSLAYVYVEHPSYLSVIILLDSVLIALFNRLRGKEDKSDMTAGFGVVACSLILIIIKSFWSTS